MASNVIVLGIFFLLSHAKAVEILTAGLPFIATYASSFNSHIINHDIRTPVVPIQAAPLLVQPAAFPTFSRFTTNPIPIVPQALKPVNPVVQQQEPTDPAYQPNDERNESIEVEAAQRSTQDENRSRPSRLEQSRQKESDTDAPNSIFVEAQFLARNSLKATPTPVPNGFVFHSRVLGDEGRAIDDQQTQLQENQRARVQRVRVAKIQRISDQKQEVDDVREENGSSLTRKSDSQNVRPNIYGQFVTF